MPDTIDDADDLQVGRRLPDPADESAQDLPVGLQRAREGAIEDRHG